MIYKIENPIKRYIKVHDNLFDIFICFKSEGIDKRVFDLLKNETLIISKIESFLMYITWRVSHIQKIIYVKKTFM